MTALITPSGTADIDDGLDLADAFLPPYGPTTEAIVNSVFELAAQADAG